jgi:hypothetical protein
MSDRQRDIDDAEESIPGTLLFITVVILLVPLVFAGFLFQ